MEEFLHMWSIDMISGERREAKSIQRILAACQLFTKAFVCFGILHLASFIVIPLFRGGNSLPYQIWLPNNTFYLPVFIIQIYIILVLLFLVIGIDVLVIAVCAAMGIQFRLLSYKMKQIKGDLQEAIVKETLKECILYNKHLQK